MKLYINGIKAVKNQKVKTFDGETYILVDWEEPYKPSSSGRVYVKKNEASNGREFFPGVIGAEFK